jgi:hypothetical protein
MVKKTLFAIVTCIFSLSASAAWALPGVPAAGAVRAIGAPDVHTAADVTVVERDRWRGDRRWHRRHMRRDHDWNDRRYRAYRGWNRYYDRPYRWRARGCVAVGPIWFCP